MNAGRDVERLVSAWLHEEAPERAPDRILDRAARTIDRTKQRRFGAAWRDPMIVSPGRLLAAAVIIAAVVGGIGWFARSTGPGVGAPTPSPTAPPSPSVETSPAPSSSPTEDPAVVSYRAARDEICNRYSAELNPLKADFVNRFDDTVDDARLTAWIDGLETFADGYDRLTAELSTLEPPPEIAADHEADVRDLQQMTPLIRQIAERLGERNWDAARSVDQATNPLAVRVGNFEERYGLAGCP